MDTLTRSGEHSQPESAGSPQTAFAPESESSAKWSIDFVEHLRSVHFVLLTFCVAILILLSGNKAERDRRAANALTQITQISDLHTNWRTTYKQTVSQHEAQLEPLPQQHVIVEISSLLSRTPRYLVLQGVDKFQAASLEVSDVPATLAGFRNWWELWRQGVTIRFLDTDGYRCHATLLEGKTENHYSPLLISGQPVASSCRVLDPDYIPPIFTPVVRAMQPSPEDHSDKSEATAPPVMLATFLGGHKFVGAQVTLVRGAGERLIHQSILHESSLKLIFEDWQTGPYETVFPDLAALTSDLMNISFPEVQKRLNDLQPKGDETIEALGLKVPLAQITQWGTFLLLSLQLYFLLHLREFSGKVTCSSPGGDVAWIGVYRSKMALTTTLLSACLFPAICLAVLIGRMPTDLAPSSYHWAPAGLCWTTGLLGSLLIVATASRFFRIRRALLNQI